MKKKFFKSKTQLVIYSFLFIICIILFIIIGKTDFQKDIDTEAEKFSSLYNMVSDDNLYVFCDATDVLNIIDGRSGIILMGFPSNKWTNYYANILDLVSKELDVDKIYYYNFQKDREESNGTYETIVKRLSVYVPVDDEGFQDIQAPTILIVKEGSIIAYFDDTSIMKGNVTPEVYYTESQKSLVYEGFKTALTEYIK